MSKVPVWSWTDAIAKTSIPPLTKLVCLNIARYLSSAGTGWRITVEQMVRDTGMGEKSVRIHLAKAKAAGLLAVIKHHDGKGHRTPTEYRPRFPANVMLDSQPAEFPPLPDYGVNMAYRYVNPLGPRTGQVSSQVEEGYQKEDSDVLDNTRRNLIAGATTNPLDAWGPER